MELYKKKSDDPFSFGERIPPKQVYKDYYRRYSSESTNL